MPSPPLEMGELEQAIAATAAPARLVAPRVLRRVIRQHRELTGLQLDVPHGDVYVIAREPLLKLVERDELGSSPVTSLPERVILIRQPDQEELETTPAPAILLQYWRLLFHGMVHLAAEERMARGDLSPSPVRCWIRRLGMQQFCEIREVLDEEGLLFDPDDAATVLIEATAVFWELRHFSPRSLRTWFPGIEDPDRVAEVLREVVDPRPLLQACRPKGAPKPPAESSTASLDSISLGESSPESALEGFSGLETLSGYPRLERRAKQAADRGNLVRALLLWTFARSRAPREKIGRARAAIRRLVDRLIQRLLAALEEPRADPDPWRAALINLVQLAARGFWTAEARLLYDLQKVCIDRERSVYRLDLLRWLASFGRRPLQSPLPHQQNVSMCRHLHSARRRLARVRLTEEQGRQLDALLEQASERAEGLVRSEMRPLMRQALEGMGLSAENVPERVATEKLVEELLDRIVERGFLTMGDLRDALARNQLKLHDLARPTELIVGDELLRVDRQLGGALRGVYRRGEFYMRWMQSISSLAFGTPWGRFFTRFLAVPFGGAYLLEAGLRHVLHPLTGSAGSDSPLAVFLLGGLLLALLNSERCRAGFLRLMARANRAARFCFLEFPQRMLNIPLFRLVLRSKWFRLGYRVIVKPALLTALLGLTISWRWPQWDWTFLRLAVLFVAVAGGLNTRFGRDMEEIATEWVLQAWRRLRLQLFAVLFTWVMGFFRRVLDAVERLLYAVDEWLQFRTMERAALLALKAVVTPAWWLLRYVVRFCINLLVEPQINPIKHFPVVTVSHKVLLPFIPALAGVLSLTMDKASAYFIAGTVIALIPGVCGFLVWELRENWRLYRANRPIRLHPVPVGPHGETIPRLLRPGFHSGAIPKRFARLRRVERRAGPTGNPRAVRRQLLALREIELCLRRHIERDFLALLRESAAWPGQPFAVGAVRVGTNRIVTELSAGSSPAGEARLTFDLCSDCLLAAFGAPGWLPQLNPKQRTVLKIALIGLYKDAGVDFVREAIESRLAPQVAAYHLQEDRMVLWVGSACEEEVICELGNGDLQSPRTSFPESRFLQPGTSLSDVDFAATVVPYQDWVDAWSRPSPAGDRVKGLPASVRVLPDEP